MTARRGLRVALVGHAFMGRAHTEAWARVARAFPEVDPPVRAVLVGSDPARTEAAATRLGFSEWSTDWHQVVLSDDIDLVDVCAPGYLHADVAQAALEALKHVLCEKPLANTVQEARAMADAARRAEEAGIVAMVGFNYRRIPALAMGRQCVAEGRLGVLRHLRAAYLQDWLIDPSSSLSWRLKAELAGSGALGDLGSHLVDLARYLTGEEITSVMGSSETFVRRRPLSAASSGDVAGADVSFSAKPSLSGAPGEPATGEVTVDDAVAFLGRLSGGALASFEATRYATGAKNALRIELYGSLGAVTFDLERPNELILSEGTGPAAGPTRVLVTEPDHPYLSGWWPPGHVLGWEHSFVHQARDLLTAIAEGRQAEPSFADGLAVQEVLDAVQSSVRDRTWVTPGRRR